MFSRVDGHSRDTTMPKTANFDSIDPIINIENIIYIDRYFLRRNFIRSFRDKLVTIVTVDRYISVSLIDFA